MPCDPAYQAGKVKLSVGNYKAAQEYFASVDRRDTNYLQAYHNRCIAAFALATTPDEIEALLSDLDIFCSTA